MIADNITDYLEGKVVLITGGTGSLGQILTREMLKSKVKAIRIYSRGEHQQVDMESQFREPRLRFLIGDVRDKERLIRAMHDVDFVIHAAALKVITTVEYNVLEGIRTNVIGSSNVVEAAIDAKVSRCLLISSDKAAHPNTTYGMQKAVAERLFILGNVYGNCRFACTRYGNVAFSQGSYSLWLRNHADSEVTLTDSRMTRFWISLPDAASFVISSLRDMHGGEIFVPKLPSFLITDLIKSLRPNAYITAVGIRPGEKLHEVMVTEDESRHTIEQGWRYVILPEFRSWTEEPLLQGTPMEAGSEYRSDTNKQQLSVEGISSYA